MAENVTPERPKFYGEEIDALVVEDLLPKVLQWFKQSGDDDVDADDVRKDLSEAVFRAEDGYHFAKELDSCCGWDSDSDLVEILDEVFFVRMRAHKMLVKAWVSQHGVVPEFSVGQRVTFKKGPWDKKTVSGEITKVLTDEATYLVFSEELGHVRKVDKGSGTTGIYVPYEGAQLEQSGEPTTPDCGTVG